MNEMGKFTVYLDQNVISHLRDGEKAKAELTQVLKHLQEHGAVFVYSNVHVQECRAFHDPSQYVQALNEIDGHYRQTSMTFGVSPKLISGMAHELILGEQDFSDKCISFLSHQMITMQYILGWLGEVEAHELMKELEVEVDLWVQELERETIGILDTSSIRQELLSSLHSVDLEALKQESLAQQPKNEREWNHRFSQIDKLSAEEVVDYIFTEVGAEAVQQLTGMFPKNAWPDGVYKENGTLTSLALFLFCQGVARDPGVKKKGQSNRRRRFLAQFRDCQHIEEAAQCHVFVSNDAGAIKLTKAVFAHAGVGTHVKQILINLE